MARSEPALVDLDPAARHRAVGRRFTEVAAGVGDWDAPSPCEGWAARDVVGHLVGWLPGLLESSAGVVLDPVTPADRDPVAAWRERYAGVQALLTSPAAGRAVRSPHFAGTLADMVDAFWTGDVFLHTWDLARASGQEPRLDEGLAERMLAGMRPMDAALRASGHYGPAVPVPDDAPVQDRLVAFTGRDPRWRA